MAFRKECGMKRVLVLMGALLIAVAVPGCGSDPREGLVDATAGDVETAATKVTNIRMKIEDAVKKTEAGKTPDFKEALLEVDALKRIAKEMQEFKIKADALKDKTTEEERKDLADKIKPRLNNAIERVAKAKKELNETMAAVEAQHKDALKTVREKLAEADGEFEAISRAR
jgi:ribosome recycling factor